MSSYRQISERRLWRSSTCASCDASIDSQQRGEAAKALASVLEEKETLFASLENAAKQYDKVCHLHQRVSMEEEDASTQLGNICVVKSVKALLNLKSFISVCSRRVGENRTIALTERGTIQEAMGEAD